jgi:hypothetical protein
MKIGGVEVKGPSEQVLVLPRPLDEDIVIRCKAVPSMEPFKAMCPEPKAKPILVAGGFKPNEKDPNYLKAKENHTNLQFAYMALVSLEPSKIEWEKVDMGNPSTWTGWEQELKDAGLAEIEVNRIVQCVMQANALDDDMLEKARDSFLLGMEVPQEKSSGPRREPPSTLSGEPAKG